MKTHEELIKQVKELISQNKTGKAISLLEKADLPKLEINIINLSSRHSKLSKDMQLNILDNDTIERTLNKINVDLFELLNTIEEGGAIEEVEEKPIPKKVEEVAPLVQTNQPQKKSPTKVVNNRKEKTVSSNTAPHKSNSKMYIMMVAGFLLLAAGAFWIINDSNKQDDIAEPAQPAPTEQTAKDQEAAAAKANAIRELERIKKEAVVGNYFEGGIIFYVEQNENELRGLIAAQGDASRDKISWLGNNKSPDQANAFKSDLFDGKSNTEKLLEKFKSEEVMYPAKLCDIYSTSEDGKTYDDWYLPSEKELDKIFDYSNVKGSKLEKSFSDDYYWSSTEKNNANVYYRSFYKGKGGGKSYTKLGKNNNKGKVRPIRQFIVKKVKE